MKIKSKVYIWSLGHSNVSLNTFLNKLKEHQIQLVADCRTKPFSRFSHFNEKPLREALIANAIKYLFKGANLGGRAVNVDYEETIDELSTFARQGERVCLLCSEKDYTKCHRYTVLTPSFEQRGILVFHIKYNDK